MQTPDSFKNNLWAIANRLCKDTELSESKNIEDAAVITLTHVITSVQIKSGYIHNFLNVEQFDALDAEISAIFLCFVGNPLTIYLKSEGINLSVNELIISAGFGIFYFLDSKRAAQITHRGVERYKAIMKSTTNMKLSDYTNTVNDGVWAYVMSKDERLMDAFTSLYMTLFNAQEK